MKWFLNHYLLEEHPIITCLTPHIPKCNRIRTYTLSSLRIKFWTGLMVANMRLPLMPLLILAFMWRQLEIGLSWRGSLGLLWKRAESSGWKRSLDIVMWAMARNIQKRCRWEIWIESSQNCCESKSCFKIYIIHIEVYYIEKEIEAYW